MRFLASLIACGCIAAGAQAESPLRILLLTKSAGFEHSTVKSVDGQPSFLDKMMAEIAGRIGATVTATKDAGTINKDNLKNYDLVVFYTTEDLTTEGNDKAPPMGPNGVQELLDWIKAGGGYVGFHCASDTFHRERNQYAPESPYLDMVGGEFNGHGAQFEGTVRVVSPDHPTMKNIPQDWRIKDEWYTFKHLQTDTMHVLALLESGAERAKQAMYNTPAYPIIWCSTYGEGRVYFNAMGHREDVWEHPSFQAAVIDALKWSAGEGEAAATPNAAEVIPTEIPPAPAAEAAPAQEKAAKADKKERKKKEKKAAY